MSQNIKAQEVFEAQLRKKLLK